MAAQRITWDIQLKYLFVTDYPSNRKKTDHMHTILQKATMSPWGNLSATSLCVPIQGQKVLLIVTAKPCQLRLVVPMIYIHFESSNTAPTVQFST